ncbi:Epididymal-specific lipocalin-5 [Apodemus speciosus]|uniref:Epididymal-specific lipocalin-5 n=1 Tax=Apodemus speciosus TaxID=105296 RepID=A0ABQ0EH07_APOSI
MSGHPEARTVSPGWRRFPEAPLSSRHMEGIMLFTLLGLPVGLAADTEGAAVKDFDVSKFLGFWYEIALASKMGAHGLAQKGEKIGAMAVELKENLLALTTAYHNEDHCVLEKVVATQGDGPAKFKVTRISGVHAYVHICEKQKYSQEQRKKEVVVVATDYMTYAVIDITFLVAGAAHRAMKLYSRGLDNNEEALNNFQKIALKHGFSETDIYILKHDLTCVNALQSWLTNQSPEADREIKALPKPGSWDNRTLACDPGL